MPHFRVGHSLQTTASLCQGRPTPSLRFNSCAFYGRWPFRTILPLSPHSVKSTAGSCSCPPALQKGNVGWAFLPVNHGLDGRLRLVRRNSHLVTSPMPNLLRVSFPLMTERNVHPAPPVWNALVTSETAVHTERLGFRSRINVWEDTAGMALGRGNGRGRRVFLGLPVVYNLAHR